MTMMLQALNKVNLESTQMINLSLSLQSQNQSNCHLSTKLQSNLPLMLNHNFLKFFLPIVSLSVIQDFCTCHYLKFKPFQKLKNN